MTTAVYATTRSAIAVRQQRIRTGGKQAAILAQYGNRDPNTVAVLTRDTSAQIGSVPDKITVPSSQPGQTMTLEGEPVKWRNDYSLPAIEMLEELQASDDPQLRDLVRRTVVVASHNQGDLDPRCRQHLMPYFTERTQAVIEIAPDPHIAEGNVIHHDQLSPATRRQAERLAAETTHAIRAGLDTTDRTR